MYKAAQETFRDYSHTWGEAMPSQCNICYTNEYKAMH